MSGATGGLGGFVVQLAKQAGLNVIADAAAPDQRLVEVLGADHIVERGDGIAERVGLAPGGVDGLVDTALLHEEVVAAVKDNGVFVSVRGWMGQPTRGIRFASAAVGKEFRSQDKLEVLRDAVERGALTPRVYEVLPVSEVAEAHRGLEAGGVRGRYVLTF